MRLSLFIIVLTLIPISLSAHQKFIRSQLLMGNVLVTLTIDDRASKRESAYDAMSDAFQEARHIELAVSEWQPESQTFLLNRNAGKKIVPIGSDLVEILQEAEKISNLTHGAFDVTFPSKKSGVTYQDIRLWPEFSLAYLPKGVTIGVSGIAKGYIVDRMADVLRKHGFKKFLVDAGDLYGSGTWKIGIRDPKDPSGNTVVKQIKIKNQAVSTSGLYERGGHIIDPKTRQAPHALSSITVISDRSIISDALATGLFVLAGREKMEEIQKLVSSQEHIEFILVTNDGQIKRMGKDF